MSGINGENCDFLVIGAGVVGLSLALELRKRNPNASIIVIDKEKQLAAHGSGRNSGVLHAGFYYTADSLKAKLTRDGNREWQEYCQEHGLRLNRCGKLVVAADETEIEGLRELKRRGDKNGVKLEWLTEPEAQKIEPRVKTTEAALWSPATASVDPNEVMASLFDNALKKKIDVRLGEAFINYDAYSDRTKTTRGSYSAGYVVNAAGLYADRIAQHYGFSKNHRIIPFKGLYLYAQSESYKPSTNIYPVPNLKHPFLGVHFTITVDGKSKIGPTAIPAFWRENYKGADNFRMREVIEILLRETELFAFNRFGFRSLAFEEVKKYSRKYMAACASKMMSGVTDDMFLKWGRPGIRAQLIDIKNKSLEMDFKLEGDHRSLHVLNAVSPAFTCAMPFARYMADHIEAKTKRESGVEEDNASNIA